MTTKKIQARELPIPSGAAEDPDALEILRVWVRHDAHGETAVTANHRLEIANPDPSGIGGVIGSACVSIVEDMIEDLLSFHEIHDGLRLRVPPAAKTL